MTATLAPLTQHQHFVPLTAEQARQLLRQRGVTITAFAADHGFNRDTVADLLNGRASGNYGESHRAAVALGMKANPESPTKSRKRAAARRA